MAPPLYYISYYNRAIQIKVIVFQPVMRDSALFRVSAGGDPAEPTGRLMGAPCS
jgi:hypothetical protein